MGDQPPPPDGTAPPAPRGERALDIVAAVGLGALVLAGLGLAVVDVAQRQHQLRPLRQGDAAPPFLLPPLDGGPKTGVQDFTGQVVFIAFWATWCPPCVRELPDLARLHHELKGRGFTVLAVNREPEDLPGVEAFLRQRPVPFPVVVDTDGVGERYRLVSLPAGFLVGRDGRVVRPFYGFTEPPVLRAAIMAALAP
jgi:peroxiredoxin